MATVEERVKVLKMIEDGKVSAEEGTRLLAALDKSRQRGQRSGRGSAPPVEGNGRWIRLRVSDTRSGKTKVNMQLPLGLVNMGLQIGARFVPEIDSLDAGQIQNALRSGVRGKVLEVTSDSGELVEIYVE
jgi:hypothetical protein